MADHLAEQRSFIGMVHRLIEECLLFNMSKEECSEALSKRAIDPAVTSAVWNQLEKENERFFEAYHKIREVRGSEAVKRERIYKLAGRPTPPPPPSL